MENATTAVGLPDHDIVEIVDNEKNETDGSTSGGTSDVSLTELVIVLDFENFNTFVFILVINKI